jgi:hypothetical protein
MISLKILELLATLLLLVTGFFAITFGGVYFKYWAVAIIAFICFRIYKNWNLRHRRYWWVSILFISLLWLDILYNGPFSQLLNIKFFSTIVLCIDEYYSG